VDAIVHGGDVSGVRTGTSGRLLAPCILKKLADIAPVHAVRGNVDKACDHLPLELHLRRGNHQLWVHHSHIHCMRLPLHTSTDEALKKSGADIVIFGHSHVPSAKIHDGILFVNPGSAGPQRHSLPVCCALLRLGPQGSKPQVEFLDLEAGGRPLQFRGIQHGQDYPLGTAKVSANALKRFSVSPPCQTGAVASCSSQQKPLKRKRSRCKRGSIHHNSCSCEDCHLNNDERFPEIVAEQKEPLPEVLVQSHEDSAQLAWVPKAAVASADFFSEQLKLLHSMGFGVVLARRALIDHHSCLEDAVDDLLQKSAV